MHSWMKVVRLKGTSGNMVSLPPRPSGITVSLHLCKRTRSSERISTMEYNLIFLGHCLLYAIFLEVYELSL